MHSLLSRQTNSKGVGWCCVRSCGEQEEEMELLKGVKAIVKTYQRFENTRWSEDPQIFKARCISTKEKVLVKLYEQDITQHGFDGMCMRELAFLQHIKHPHVEA